MSALQKVEEAYLGILRLAIIVVSSLLLVAAVGLGLMSVSALRGGEKATLSETGVRAEEVISKVAAEPEWSVQKPEAPARKKDDLSNDPNKPYYLRTADAIIKFSEKYAPGYFEIQQDRLIGILKDRVDRYKDNPKTAATFAYGLSDTMEKGLANPAIIKRVEKAAKAQAEKHEAAAAEGENAEEQAPEAPFKESPFQIAEEILEAYTLFFDAKESEREAAKARQAAEDMERMETARMQLYMAGAAFVAFLLLVFISLVVKIERNLRDIASLAK